MNGRKKNRLKSHEYEFLQQFRLWACSNQNNVSELNNIYIAVSNHYKKNPTKRDCLVQNGHHQSSHANVAYVLSII